MDQSTINTLEVLVGFGLMAWAAVTIIRAFLVTKMQVVDSQLIVKAPRKSWIIFVDENRGQSIEKVDRGVRTVSVTLSDIEQITLDELKGFDKNSGALNSVALNNALQTFRNANVRGMPGWIGFQFSAAMFVSLKSGDSFVVSLKPFSKALIRNTLSLVESKGIKVTVQPSLNYAGLNGK